MSWETPNSLPFPVFIKKATLDRMQIETRASLNEDLEIDGFYKLVKDSEHQLLNRSGLLDV